MSCPQIPNDRNIVPTNWSNWNCSAYRSTESWGKIFCSCWRLCTSMHSQVSRVLLVYIMQMILSVLYSRSFVDHLFQMAVAFGECCQTQRNVHQELSKELPTQPFANIFFNWPGFLLCNHGRRNQDYPADWQVRVVYKETGEDSASEPERTEEYRELGVTASQQAFHIGEHLLKLAIDFDPTVAG